MGATPAQANGEGGASKIQSRSEDLVCDSPTHPAWVQVWDGNFSNKLGHPLSPGWGSREGAGERAEKAAANFPLPCCLHPSDELAPGFVTFSPGQVCQDRLAGFCWLPAGSEGPALLGADTRGEPSGSTEDPLDVGGGGCSSQAGQAGRVRAPLGSKA